MILSFTISLTGLFLVIVCSLLVSFVIIVVSNHYRMKQFEKELYESTGMTVDEFEKWLEFGEFKD